MGLASHLWLAQMLIALSGIPLSLAAYVAMGPVPLAPRYDWRDAMIGAVILVIFSGFIEEIRFRGVLQRVTTEIFGRWGIVWTSILFAMMYVGTLSAAVVVLKGIIGLFLGWCVERTGAIWGCCSGT